MKKLRILISRPDRIGDVVLSTPIPREIKKQYPDSFITMILRPYTKDIFYNNPFVDEVIVYNESEEKFSYFKKLREIRRLIFSHAIMLLPNERLNYLLFLAGIKNRIGVGHKFYQFISNVKSVFRNKYIPLRHESEYCLDTIRKLGIEVENNDPEIYLTDDEKKEAFENKLNILDGHKFLIGIHTTSGNSAPNWEIKDYYELIKLLQTNNSIKIAVTDNNIPDELKDVPGIIYLNCEKPLRESIVNFSMLDLLVSASTGPMHLAAALKVKTLSLFCPMTACSPELWGPKGNKSKVILPESDYCRNKCPGDPKICKFSNGGITVDRIFTEVIQSVSNN